MPKGDRTGPMGSGAKSGRGAGFCRGFNMPGYANAAGAGSLGMGGSRGRGGWGGSMAGGRGWRHRCFAIGRPGRMYSDGYAPAPQPFNPELEKESLKNRFQALQSELDAINQRLGEIDSEEQAP